MTTALKVGVFATLCLLVLGFFILRIEDWNPFRRGGSTVSARFDSVAGLDDKAAVRVAGVRVGSVDGVGLHEDGKSARITLRLDQPVRLTEGSTARLASAGLLGEKYVEIVPGPADAPALPSGVVLEGTTPMGFDEAMAKLSGVADSIGAITDSVAGRGGETSLSRLIENLEAVSLEIRALVAANRSQVDATVANFERLSGTLADELPRLAAQLERVLGQVDSVITENRSTLQESMANVRELTGRLQTSVDNLNTITSKIASGEGTIGKLVSSDEAHDTLVDTLGSIEGGVKSLTDTLGRAQKLKLYLGAEGSYLTEAEDSRAAFRLDADPQSGRFYRVEIVDDPRGRVRRKTHQETVTLPDGTVETTTTRSVTREEKTTLSAQFGFTFGNARLRAGLFESTGGAGVDYALLRDRVSFSLDAFDFGRQDDTADEGDLAPHLRVTGRYWLRPSIFLQAGYDDFLESERDSLFLGAGVRWSDDDIKYLLGSIPRF
jgi:phospholipid/cholesterol/gamma-HCH transport system substrate-binding protein